MSGFSNMLTRVMMYAIIGFVAYIVTQTMVEEVITGTHASELIITNLLPISIVITLIIAVVLEVIRPFRR